MTLTLLFPNLRFEFLQTLPLQIPHMQILSTCTFSTCGFANIKSIAQTKEKTYQNHHHSRGHFLPIITIKSLQWFTLASLCVFNNFVLTMCGGIKGLEGPPFLVLSANFRQKGFNCIPIIISLQKLCEFGYFSTSTVVNHSPITTSNILFMVRSEGCFFCF